MSDHQKELAVHRAGRIAEREQRREAQQDAIDRRASLEATRAQIKAARVHDGTPVEPDQKPTNGRRASGKPSPRAACAPSRARATTTTTDPDHRGTSEPLRNPGRCTGERPVPWRGARHVGGCE